MKTFHRLFYLPLFVLWFYTSTIAQTFTIYDNPCDATGCMSKRFMVSDIPQIPEFQNYTGTYRFFWYMGDGNCYDYTDNIDSNADFTFQDHTYETSGSYDVYLEAVPIYEDDKPPKRMIVTNGQITVDCNHVTCASPVWSPPSSSFSVKTNRDLVPDQMVSYIMTYAHLCGKNNPNPITGSIRATYDSDLIVPDPDPDLPSVYPGATYVGSSNPDINGMVTAEWGITNLQENETRNIIFPMVVSNQVLEDDVIQISFELNMEGCPSPGIINISKTVRNSHDPNNLDSNKSKTCDVSEVDLVEYTIRFKNDGDTIAKRVVLKDIIPEFFDISSIHTTYPANSTSLHQVNPQTREVTWTLSGSLLRGSNTLKGTRQYGYGQYIHDEHCIDSLVFEIEKHINSEIMPCMAIINRAEIIFDCNPSIYTNPHIIRFGCTLNPSTAVPCDSCDEVSIIKTFSGIYTNQAIALDLPNGSQIGTGAHLTWYPSVSLNSFTAPVPLASPLKKTDYYLTANDPSCHIGIYRNTVDVPCNLQISHEITCANGLKSIKAWVLGGSANLVWQDCTPGNTLNLSDVKNNYLYLSVVDTVTGCSANKMVEMKKCPVKINLLFYIGTIALALGMILLAAGVMDYFGWP